MEKKLPKWLLFSALVVWYLLHNDLWLWNTPTFLLGLPIGLLYHIFYCIATSMLFIFLIRFFWPSHLDIEEGPQP